MSPTSNSWPIRARRLADEIERRRLVLVEADRAVRVLDLLDEKHQREHRRQAERQETKRLDEVAMTRRPKTRVN